MTIVAVLTVEPIHKVDPILAVEPVPEMDPIPEILILDQNPVIPYPILIPPKIGIKTSLVWMERSEALRRAIAAGAACLG